MINLFIDTNIYLELFGHPEKSLKSVAKITDLIKDGKITLWLPEQVKNEFYRKRDDRILEIYKKIENFLKTINQLEIPVDKKGKIRETLNNIENLKDELEKIKKNIKQRKFFTDEIIKELFTVAKLIPLNDEIVEKAMRRSDLGNPPGKKNSYGDAVIWESLLNKFPKGKDLYFVGNDNDFYSKLSKNDFSSFLKSEWEKEKESDIKPFRKIGDFVKKVLPGEIEATEIIAAEKKIEELASAPITQQFAYDPNVLMPFGQIGLFTEEDSSGNVSGFSFYRKKPKNL